MLDWKKCLISAKYNVRETMEAIDSGPIKFAIVVSDENQLLGVVTDGDIRRGILSGVSMTDPVETIMNRDPFYILEDEDPQTIQTKMKIRGHAYAPIVTQKKEVLGIERDSGSVAPRRPDNWVVIMAGGAGKRLLPITEDTPKPLIKVGEKPILETILENFIEFGFSKFFISVNYKSEMIEEHFGDGSKWNVQIDYLRESEFKGTAGALSLIPEKPQKPLIVMNGDLLTKIDFQKLLEFHMESKSPATMCIREYEFSVPYGVVKTKSHHIFELKEKPSQRFFVNAGIYVLDPTTFEVIPRDQFLDMTTLFNSLIAKKKFPCAFPIREYWLDIGHHTDLDRAQDDYTREFE